MAENEFLVLNEIYLRTMLLSKWKIFTEFSKYHDVPILVIFVGTLI